MRKLFVGGINWNATNEDLAEFFREYGTVTEAKIITDRETGRSRGFGFVTFENEDGAQLAKSNDGVEMQGRALRIDFANEQSRGGNRGGNGNRDNRGGGGGNDNRGGNRQRRSRRRDGDHDYR